MVSVSNASTPILLDAVNYEPFGPVNSYVFGNGLSRSVEYDQTYRTTTIHNIWLTHEEMVNYEYDRADRIKTMVQATRNQTVSSNWNAKAF